MKEWQTISAEQVLLELGSTLQGLSEDEVEKRRGTYGANSLSFAKSTPGWLIFFKQFISPMILLLLGAALVTALLQDWVDFGAIMVALLMNAIIGWWQETKAQSEVRALAAHSLHYCQVRRDDKIQNVLTTDVVPGDIVLLQSGDKVPADTRLIETEQLQIDESMLTGENLTVTKSIESVEPGLPLGDHHNMAYSGTLVASGRAQGVVVGIGENTEIGRINALVQMQAPETPLRKLMHAFELRIGTIVLTVAVLMFVYGALTSDDLTQVFMTTITLVVAVMPEALPVVVTVALAVGVSRMAKNNAIVRSLHSVETLGSVTVIASDKTGTLTQNLLTVTRLWTPSDGHLGLAELSSVPLSNSSQETLIAGALGNEAIPVEQSRTGFLGDAVDVAMAAAACQFELVTPEEIGTAPIDMTPYEPTLGYAQMVREHNGELVLYVKGAPGLLLERSITMLNSGGEPVKIDADLIERANLDLADQGLRVLATAKRIVNTEQIEDVLADPQGLTFLGLEGMQDPPRDGVAESVAACQQAGIRVIMVTGDHPVTAKAIARELGIPEGYEPITGAELAHLSDDQLTARLGQTNIVARVNPADKLRIVQLLQEQGMTVAVTGDGVNDAPALKAASVGVAMGKSGTEVAREASDIILTDDNFNTIIGAVRQGRVTFAAIRKSTFFLLANGMSMLIAMPLSVVLGLPQLFLPVQILWLNIVIDGVQDIGLALEPAEGDELTQKPRKKSEGLMNATIWTRTFISGLWMAALLLFTFSWAIHHGMTETHARSFALTLMVLLCFFLVGNAKTEIRSIFSVKPFNNPFLFVSSALALLVHFGAMHWGPTQWLLSIEPLTLEEWIWCGMLGSTILVIVELEKWVRRGIAKRAEHKR